MAAGSAAGLGWTFARAGKLVLAPQAAILAVSRGGGTFLDSRAAADYAAGHIPKSQNIPDSELPTRLPSIAKFKQKPIVLVCPNGMQAKKTVGALTKDGFTKVHVLAGGVAGWRDANLPLFNKKNKK